MRTIHANNDGSGNRSGIDINNKIPAKSIIEGGNVIAGDEVLLYADTPYENKNYTWQGKATGPVVVRPAPGHKIIIKGMTGNPLNYHFSHGRSSTNGVFRDIEIQGNALERDERLVKTQYPGWSAANASEYFLGRKVKHVYYIWSYISSTPNLTTQPGTNGSVWRREEKIIENVALFYFDGINNKLQRIRLFNSAASSMLAPSQGQGGETRGCISLMNGWIDHNGKGHGHGFYMQHAPASPHRRKSFFDTALHNMRRGIQNYGGDPIEKYDVEGFCGFLNASINPEGWTDNNAVIGSLRNDQDIHYNRAVFYHPHKRNVQIGYGDSVSTNVNFTNGYIWGGEYALYLHRTRNSSYTGNKIIAANTQNLIIVNANSWADFQSNTINNNTYYDDNFKIQLNFHNRERPAITFTSFEGWKDYTGKDLNSQLLPKSALRNYTQVDQYYPEFGRVIICNHEGLNFVPVNVSGLGLINGKDYEFRDHQHLEDRQSFIYNAGNPIVYFPMTQTAISKVIGRGPIQPAHSSKEFCTFDIQPLGWLNEPHMNGITLPRYQAPIVNVAKPLNLNVSVSGYTATVTWTNANNAYTTTIRQKKGAVLTYTTVAAGVTSHVFTNLDPSMQYCYAVQHTSGTTNSGYTDEKCVTTAAPPPVAPLINRVAIVRKDGTAVRDLSATDTIDIDTVGNDFAFEMFPNSTTKSIKITIGAYVLVENLTRWASFGNTGNTFKTWYEKRAETNLLADPLTGSPHSVQFTPYSESNATGTAGSTLTYRVSFTKAAPNNPPVIYPVGDQVTEQDTAIQVPFLLQDENPTALNVYAVLPATTIIQSIVFSAPGTNMTATMTPKAGQTGTEKIQIYASDGVNPPAYLEFMLTVERVVVVNDPPVLSPISEKVMPRTSELTVPFTITAGTVPVNNLVLSASSSNLELLSNSNLSISGTGNTRTLLIRSGTRHGNTIITIRANDGQAETKTSFNLEITKVRINHKLNNAIIMIKQT